MNNVYGYCRCSTNETKQDISYQYEALLNKGVKVENIRFEYESGRKAEREVLNKLLDTIESGSTIIVTDITRLTRSIKHLCLLVEVIVEKKLQLLIDNFDIDARDGSLNPMVECMLLISGIFGEMEVKLKVRQIKLGLESARNKGKTLGRPKTNYDNIPDNFMKYYPKYVSKSINKKEFSRLTNLSYPTIYKYINIVETKES